jgi:hypothetical protein
MRKPLIALCLLTLTLPFGCNSEEDAPPDPLAKREGFCEAWAKSACQQTVVDACDSGSIDDCVDAQSDYCLSLIPESYGSKRAKECLAAVKAAYKDADLTSEELEIVLKLGAPCDQLSKGIVEEGGTCEGPNDCNTAGGFVCVTKLGAAEGSCEEPEEIPAGNDCSGDAAVCAEGYFCNGDDCVARRATGKACDGDYECKVEDRCVFATEGEPGVCTARVELNEACTADDDCQSHLCVIESGATEGECASRIRLSRSEPLCDHL